jgi:hypothetical protein
MSCFAGEAFRFLKLLDGRYQQDSQSKKNGDQQAHEAGAIE